MGSRSMGRFEGRLFADDGRLFLVVEANETTGLARVTCRIEGERRVLEMPLTEVSRRISAGANLSLDNINGSESSSRVVKRDDGWYFSTREGLKGPHGSEEEARTELGNFVIAAQSAVAT